MKSAVLLMFLGYLAISHAYVVSQSTADPDADAGQKKEQSEKNDKEHPVMRSRKQEGDRSDRDSESAEEINKVKDAVAIGIDTGNQGAVKSDGVDMLVQAVKNLIKDKGPYFRSRNFELNDGNKRSKSPVGVELNTKRILDTVNDFLSSKRVKKAADRIARKAAIIFRALRDDDE